MPLPVPRPEETQDKFISRCLHEIKDENKSHDQKVAICFSQFRRKNKKTKSLLIQLIQELRKCLKY